MALNFFNYQDMGASTFPEEGQILGDFTEEDWREFLTFLRRRSFAAGETILNIGEVDSTLYILSSGSVDVIVAGTFGPKTIAVIHEGSVFGEMAFFDGAPRSATVVAREAVEVLALDKKTFLHLSAWRPQTATKLLLDLGRILCARLRRINSNA